VYAHVLDAPPAPEEAEGPAAPDRIARSLYQIALSAEPTLAGSRGRVVLGGFMRRAGGGFTMDPEYVPPLVLVGPSPYLRERLSELRADLESFGATLSGLIAAEGAEGDPVRAAQRARIEAVRMGALLDDVAHGIYPHPYVLFAALRGLLLELFLLDGSAPDAPLPRYEHEELGRSFGEIVRLLARKLSLPPLRAPHILFTREDGRFIAADLPPALLSAPEVYLVLRPSEGGPRPTIDAVRLASPARLRAVHERSLRGVRVVPVSRAPIKHGFGPEAETFRLVTTGSESPEWSHVVAERALCFYERPQLAGAEAALFWRAP
jgi:type VI secretion system protein ImpJ